MLRIVRRMSSSGSSRKKKLACVEDLQEAVRKGALVVDLRTDRDIAIAKGSQNVTWCRETESLDHEEILKLTKNDKSVPIIVH